MLQAGRNELTLDEIVRLHGVLIEDTRFVRAGLRTEGVFLGERDHNAVRCRNSLVRVRRT